MSLGIDLLTAILDNQDRRALSDLNVDWLVDNELALYEFLREHIREHGVFPSDGTIERAGYSLPHQGDLEPVSYYMTELPRRAIHERFRDALPALSQALDQRNVNALVPSLRDLVNFATHTRASASVSSLSSEIDGIRDELLSTRFNTGLAGVTSGYAALDGITDGYIGGDLIAIVGRPSVGKSYILFNKANLSWRSGKSVLIVSPEMLVRQCSRRILSLNTGVSADAIKRGHISTWAREGFYERIQALDGLPAMHIMAADHTKTVADIDIMVQELMPEVVYVDSAYLLQPSTNKRRNSRREYISDTFEELKGIAMNRDIPVVVSTQFNREVKRKTRMIDLSMIAESDAIGQLVSVALGVTPGSDPVNGKVSREITIMKNREGGTGMFNINFKFSPVNFSEIGDTFRDVGVSLDGEPPSINDGFED